METIEIVIQEPDAIQIEVQATHSIATGTQGECELPDLFTLYELAKI